MSWLSGLSATSRLSSRASSRTAGLGRSPSGKRRIIELVARRREEEIALVARRVGGAMQLRAVRAHDAPDIMAGGEAIGAEIAGEAKQIGELDALVAAHARDRRPSARIIIGELLDHLLAEAAFIIEDVMGEAEPIGDGARIVNVAARRSSSSPGRRRRPDRRAGA